MWTIAQLNQLSQAEFVQAIGRVFEDTPAIAAQVWSQRPFTNAIDLHQKMVAILLAMSESAQVALIQAHPDLGSKVKMTDASVQEQAGAGLDRLTSEEYQRFQSLNQAYRSQFGFPLIIAVRNHTKASILEAFDRRLQHSLEQERSQALTEIAQIAYFRLTDLIQSD